MYKDYEIKLNAILDKHGVQKVELGLIDDLDKKIQNAKKEVGSAERLHKAAEKDNNKVNKLNAEWIDLKAKAKKEVKTLYDLVKFAKNNIKEAKTELTSTEKQIQKIKKSLKDLGLPENAISQQISEVSKLKSTLKTLNFSFLDDLPF